MFTSVKYRVAELVLAAIVQELRDRNIPFMGMGNPPARIKVALINAIGGLGV